MVRDGYDEDVTSTGHCTNVLGCGRLRRYKLTLWKRHITFGADGDYKMFSVQTSVGNE